MAEDRELTRAEKRAAARAEKARAQEEARAKKEEEKRAREEARKARAEERKAKKGEEKPGEAEKADTAKKEKKAKPPKAGKGEKRIVTMSIEGNDLRLLYFSGKEIESWDSVAFAPNLLKVGQVSEPEGLSAVIKSALEGRDITRAQFLCSLPGLRSVSRVLTIPRTGKKEMADVVQREVNKLMTVSMEDNYLHWQPLTAEKSEQMEVFVLAVPKEPFDIFMEALRMAEIKPAAIDLKPLALARAVNQRDAIIASGESNSMELVIIVDDTPVLIRSVFLGEGIVTQDYAVGRISDELGRTILTYNEINKDKPLDPEVPIYLCGGSAGGVPFALNVAALTGRTVQPLEPPIPYPDDFPVADFMVNIGLLLKVL